MNTGAPLIEKLEGTISVESGSDYFDYAEFPDLIRRELEKSGITAEALSRGKLPERKFSEESLNQFDILLKVVSDEWKEFEKKPTKEYGDEAEAYHNYDHNSGLRSEDAMRCLEDKNRTLIFLDTIREKIKLGDRVLEAGAGTGILAIAAAMAGAEEVEALEINPETVEFATKVIKKCEGMALIKEGQVKIKLEDASKYKPENNKKFDAFISENIYTGQFYELQMQINNHLHKFIDISQNKIIPSGMINGVELTEIPDEVKEIVRGKTDFVAKGHFDPNDSKSTSDSEVYDHIDFSKEAPVGVRNRLVKTIAKDGVVDSVTIFSLIQLSEKKDNYLRRNETDFLGNDSVIMLENSLDVSRGDKIEIYISYKAGDKPGQADIRIKNLETNIEVFNIKEKNN